LFDAPIVVVIFRRVVARGQPNSETIFAALSFYLLVGFAFASIYGMVAVLQSHAFTRAAIGWISSTTALRP